MHIRARTRFVVALIALCVIVGSCKISLGLHRYRLPDFTLDVDPAYSTSYRFQFSRDRGKGTLTTTAYQRTRGKRGEQIATFAQPVNAMDASMLSDTMREVSFMYTDVHTPDVRDGTPWSFRLDSFPFLSFTGTALEAAPEIQVLERQLMSISRPFRQKIETAQQADPDQRP